jgi:nitroimidazol reductase NimA-like FMN-containing flavoprotein (pyridoxamine 5'-phosphate oxidase superfamily)
VTVNEWIASYQEMENLLRRESLGYLGLSAGNVPYVVPLNYAYADGKIVFHCALTGQKLDYIRANPQVCFTVAKQAGEVREHEGQDPCHVDSDSVICFGTARVIENPEERQAALDTFNRTFNPDAAGISLERTQNCAAVEIRVQEMTGRRERSRERTYWRYVFEP